MRVKMVYSAPVTILDVALRCVVWLTGGASTGQLAGTAACIAHGANV